MDDQSQGSDINLSGDDSFAPLSFDDDASSTTSTIYNSGSSVSDQTYTDISFDDMQEILDNDLSDDSDLEQDELTLLLEDAIGISPSKRPPAGSVVYLDEEATNDDDNDKEETSPAPPVVRNLEESFEQVLNDQQPNPPKRSRTSSTTTRTTTDHSRSIIQTQIEQKKVIWISFDIETGGPYCGIIQLSATFYDADHQELEPSFNSFCRPPPSARFLHEACVHGITSRDHEKLRNAPKVEQVWRDFCATVNVHFQGQVDYAGVLVAWNGKSCDLEWIYKLIHSSDNSCQMPQEIEYFMDPYLIIKKFKGCPLHPSKSELRNLSLSTVYKHVTGNNLSNAHDSLVDCRAQGTVIACNDFAKHKNMKTSISTIESVWSVKNKRRLEQEEELKVQPHGFMKDWKVYKSKHNGRKKFQTHLGISLMNKGIEMDWKDPYNDENKPAWMPQTIKNGIYHPCDCGICFFCLHGKTTSMAHGKVTAKPRVQKCSMKYETVPRNYCVVCVEEVKKRNPGSPMKELRKTGKIPNVRNGCKNCGVAVCKIHWENFTHLKK